MESDCDIKQELKTNLLSKADKTTYKKVGELSYLTVCTRPDISFAVGALARSLYDQTDRDSKMVKRLIRYVGGSPNFGLLYLIESQGFGMVAYSDTDWAGCTQTKHSTSVIMILDNGSPVSWKSTKKSVVALSSAESENISIESTVREVYWIHRLHAELSQALPLLNCNPISPTIIHTNNTAAMPIIKRESVNARTKHIYFRYHFVRDLHRNQVIALNFLHSSSQLADIIAKPVSYKTIHSLITFIIHQCDISIRN